MILRRLYQWIIVGVVVLLLIMVGFRSGITREWRRQLADSAVVQRPIRLRVWDWWSPSANEEYGNYFNDVKLQFEQQNPDVEIHLQIVPFGNYVQKLSTAMVGSTPPDVFQSSVYWAEDFYHRDMLRPLNDLLVADRDTDGGGGYIGREAFLPSAWRHNHTKDGVIYGIPQGIDAFCLLWNLDLLEDAAKHDDEIRAMFASRADGAVDYNRLRFDAVANWNHFRRIARKLTQRDADDRLVQAGFHIQGYAGRGGGGMFSPWLAANGGRYQDEQGARAEFDNPLGIETMQFLAQLYWSDKVCLPFRRQLSQVEQFQQGKVAAIVAGTWSGKNIMRNTQGWHHFGKTAFPPGPGGNGQRTVTWGNMFVISKRCRQVDAAWRYVKFVCSREGNLLRLRHLGFIGPRLDFYETEQWQQAVADRPYLSNVKAICLAGQKLRHTQIIAVNHQANPVFETILLRYPQIVQGKGPHASVATALELAATNVNRVFDRYHRQVSRWTASRTSHIEQ